MEKAEGKGRQSQGTQIEAERGETGQTNDAGRRRRRGRGQANGISTRRRAERAGALPGRRRCCFFFVSRTRRGESLISCGVRAFDVLRDRDFSRGPFCAFGSCAENEAGCGASAGGGSCGSAGSGGSRSAQQRRSSIVVIPPMQICPGDLLVYSKVLTQRSSVLGESARSVDRRLFIAMASLYFHSLFAPQTGRARRRAWPETRVRTFVRSRRVCLAPGGQLARARRSANRRHPLGDDVTTR